MRKIPRLLLFVAILQNLAFAAEKENLGKPLELKQQAGKLMFGFIYFLGKDDPDGNSALISLTKEGAGLPKGTKWNFYRRDTDKFVLPQWNVAERPITAWQEKLGEEGGVRQVLVPLKEMVLVFETPTGERLHLDIGKMAGDEKFASYFSNRSNKILPSEITEHDLGKAPKVAPKSDPPARGKPPGHN